MNDTTFYNTEASFLLFYVFLDMDGVMNSRRTQRAYHDLGPKYLDPVAIALFDRAVKDLREKHGIRVEVIISSVWRKGVLGVPGTVKWFNTLFQHKYAASNIQVVGLTPSLASAWRQEEIDAYRKETDTLDMPFAAIDDEATDLDPNTLIKVDANYGLSVADVDELTQRALEAYGRTEYQLSSS